MPVIQFRKLNPLAKMPEKSTVLSSGWDLRACLDTPIELRGKSTVVIGTGLNVGIPAGWEIQVRSRSGLAAKRGIFVLNSPGTIDADYSGNGYSFELKVILHNTSLDSYVIQNGDKIAQAVICPVYDSTWEEVEEISVHESNRIGGLGSTGA